MSTDDDDMWSAGETGDEREMAIIEQENCVQDIGNHILYIIRAALTFWILVWARFGVNCRDLGGEIAGARDTLVHGRPLAVVNAYE